jgi:hypothetical protein
MVPPLPYGQIHDALDVIKDANKQSTAGSTHLSLVHSLILL